MNVKIYLYIVGAMVCAFALSGVNFDKFIRKNKVVEARILYFVLSFIGGYLLAEFFWGFFAGGLV